MKTLFKSLLGLFFIMYLCSCEDNTLCEDDFAFQVPTFFDDEFVFCSLQNINPNQKEVNLAITSQAEFENYVFCGDGPADIDFREYFIIAGRFSHHQCAAFDRQQVSICDNKILYKVDMLEQDCLALTNVFYFAVIEKKYEKLPVKFEVRFIN